MVTGTKVQQLVLGPNHVAPIRRKACTVGEYYPCVAVRKPSSKEFELLVAAWAGPPAVDALNAFAAAVSLIPGIKVAVPLVVWTRWGTNTEDVVRFTSSSSVVWSSNEQNKTLFIECSQERL